jgi:transcriptional regulator with XRE-family HTH domain
MSRVHALALESSDAVTANWGMAEPAKSLAKRVQETREALDLSQAELCKAIGIKANRWSQYESGERRITLSVAHKLCDEFGVTLDWIYRANPAGLPHALRIKIRQRA